MQFRAVRPVISRPPPEARHRDAIGRGQEAFGAVGNGQVDSLDAFSQRQKLIVQREHWKAKAPILETGAQIQFDSDVCLWFPCSSHAVSALLVQPDPLLPKKKQHDIRDPALVTRSLLDQKMLQRLHGMVRRAPSWTRPAPRGIANIHKHSPWYFRRWRISSALRSSSQRSTQKLGDRQWRP